MFVCFFSSHSHILFDAILCNFVQFLCPFVTKRTFFFYRVMMHFIRYRHNVFFCRFVCVFVIYYHLRCIRDTLLHVVDDFKSMNFKWWNQFNDDFFGYFIFGFYLYLQNRQAVSSLFQICWIKKKPLNFIPLFRTIGNIQWKNVHWKNGSNWKWKKKTLNATHFFVMNTSNDKSIGISCNAQNIKINQRELS